MENLKIQALANFLECDVTEISEGYDDSNFEYGKEEYMVLTDEESDSAFSDSLDNYIDDCILCQLPENLRSYFDNEAFKRDVELSDGRGPTLAGYDGAEECEKVDGVWFYIYRTN
jgi:hypothetical protein